MGKIPGTGMSHSETRQPRETRDGGVGWGVGGGGRGEVRLVVYWVSSSIRQHSMTNGVFLRWKPMSNSHSTGLSVTGSYFKISPLFQKSNSLNRDRVSVHLRRSWLSWAAHQSNSPQGPPCPPLSPPAPLSLWPDKIQLTNQVSATEQPFSVFLLLLKDLFGCWWNA